MGAPDILKITDLKGKRVAVGTVGDTQDALITMLVEREGLTARDITRRGNAVAQHFEHDTVAQDGGV